jgi:hypothetical protein
VIMTVFFSSMVPITLLRTTTRESLYWKAGVKAVSILLFAVLLGQ